MTTDYGDSGAFICLSTSTGTGSGGIHDGETIPAGDKVYLYSTKLGGNEKFLQKIKNLAMGVSYSNKDGKYKPTVNIGDCMIVKQTLASNTAEFNGQINLLRKWHKAASSPIYLIIFSETDNLNLSLGFNPTTGAGVDYMKGYITDFAWEVKSNIYHIKGLTFTECDY